MSAIEAIGVSRSFGAVAALTEVSLVARPGEITGLIGPNGAGKSTLFNILTGFDTPDAGRVELDGRDVVGSPPHRIAELGVARTFQATRPLQRLTVQDNVLTGTHLSGHGSWYDALLPRRSVRSEERRLAELAHRALDAVGLLALADAFPSQLSAGELRLLEIARALATQPDVLLLDEPAAGLNHAESAELEKALRGVVARGTSLLLIEHDVELVFRLCDDVTVLDFGKVIMSGTPEQVRANERVAEAYFGRPATTGGGSDG